VKTMTTNSGLEWSRDQDHCLKDYITDFDTVFDELSIKRLLSNQNRFIAEYVQVMRPVCNALDKMQGKRDVGLGHLLPPLYVMTTKLDQLLEWDENKNGPVGASGACTGAGNSSSILDLLDDPLEQLRLTASLKCCMAAVAMSASLTTDVPSTVTSAIPSSSSSSAAVSDDFFKGLQARHEARCTQNLKPDH